jgi:hypothetical protein
MSAEGFRFSQRSAGAIGGSKAHCPLAEGSSAPQRPPSAVGVRLGRKLEPARVVLYRAGPSALSLRLPISCGATDGFL